MRVNSGFITSGYLLTISSFVLLVSLLFFQFTNSGSASNRSYTDEKVNLALRRTVHQLLRAAGDSTSRIPTVQQPRSGVFRVQLGRNFDYDQLPGFLQKSFRLHHVEGLYDVAVLACGNGELQLGYSVKDLLGGKDVPCQGRVLPAGCYELQVTFEAENQPVQRVPLWTVLLIGSLLAGFVAVVWQQKRNTSPVSSQPDLSAPDTLLLHFGRSVLNMTNLTLTVNISQHNLTYREAKLLRFLATHPNQILERDLILKQVWEDEGITVGRSVDVFISRLRKLLQTDPTVKISAVHGVGYRLEIQQVLNPQKDVVRS